MKNKVLVLLNYYDFRVSVMANTINTHNTQLFTQPTQCKGYKTDGSRCSNYFFTAIYREPYGRRHYYCNYHKDQRPIFQRRVNPQRNIETLKINMLRQQMKMLAKRNKCKK